MAESLSDLFCQNACKGGHNICCKGQSCDLAPDHDGRVVRNAYEETAEKGNIYYDTEEHKQIGDRCAEQQTVWFVFCFDSVVRIFNQEFSTFVHFQ